MDSGTKEVAVGLERFIIIDSSGVWDEDELAEVFETACACSWL